MFRTPLFLTVARSTATAVRACVATSQRRLRIQALALAVVLAGGSWLSARPVIAESQAMECNDAQANYVRGAIREECGMWGGRAWVQCSGHSIYVHRIECNL